MNREKLAPREHFQMVIDNMKEHGLEFLAWVTMNSKRNTYHVDSFGYAQESRLFFRAPGQAFIVMLELTQHIGSKNQMDGSIDWDYYKAYWSGFVDCSYESKKWIHAEFQRMRDEKRHWDEDIPGLSASVSDCLNNSLFSVGGGMGHSSQFLTKFEPETGRYNYEKLPDPVELTMPFGKILEIVTPYLYERFNDLQVTVYAPHYTFPDQEPEFWAKFPLPKLIRVAGRVWGSDFKR